MAETIAPLAPWRAENRQEIDIRRQALIDVITGLDGWEIVSIGAYFSYVKHPFTDHGSTEVAERLARENGVVTLPGAFFGDNQDNYLRFAFANAEADELHQLASRLA